MKSISGDMDEQDEKIFVSVRVRPMNAKEIAKNDTSDWECVSNNTIIYKHSVTERSTYPNAYTFGKHYYISMWKYSFASYPKKAGKS